MKHHPLEVRDPLPRTVPGWHHWLRARTLCRWPGIHCRARFLVPKWDGGKGAYLCRHCRLILVYGHTRPAHSPRKRLARD